MVSRYRDKAKVGRSLKESVGQNPVGVLVWGRTAAELEAAGIQTVRLIEWFVAREASRRNFPAV